MKKTSNHPPDKIDLLLNPVGDFIRNESSSGVILFVCAVIALVWANTPFSHYYHELWHYNLSVSLGNFTLDKSLHFWINDGLMAMFFFAVGLELKREIIGGELSSLRKAVLPLAAAVGGMVVPALIFAAFNHETPGSQGWGIPMATDIAFVLGIFALLGNRVPLSLKIFLTALAMADDLGAVLVIAFFYTSDISLVNLATGSSFLIVLLAANYLGVRNSIFYGVVGIGGVWLAFLMAGVHPTIAGVLAAMTIPARPRIDEEPFTQKLRDYVSEFSNVKPNDLTLLEPAQMNVIQKIKRLTRSAETPLQRLEHNLMPVVAFVVMPLFALSNAGITIDQSLKEAFFHPVFIGTFLGLFIGKWIGIVGMCRLMTSVKFAQLPVDVTWRHIMGTGFLAGVGFTMSLFIANLAYRSEELTIEARLGVMCASALSGVIGYLVLRSGKRTGQQ